MQTLPVELQTHICHLALNEDLASLSRTSTHFLDVAQPALYRHVVLKIDPSGYQEQSQSPWNRFHDTLMSRPLHFGPMSRSLTVVYGYKGVPWNELDGILKALPKLLRLDFRGWDVFPDVPNLASLSSHISPHLLELNSFPTTLGPALLHLLDSLPTLRVWRNNAESIVYSSQFTLSPCLKRIEVFEAALVDDPLVFAHVLRHMTNLTHLTISHCNFGPRRFLEAEERRRAILDAFSRCGTKLVSFTMEDSPAGSKHPAPPAGSREPAPLTWILANIVPRMPNLRRLELLPGSEAYRTIAFDRKFRYSDSAVKESDSPDPTALISIDPDELSELAMPSSLRFFTLVGSERMIGNYHRGSKIEGLSRAGWANANIIMTLFPSLPKFVYIERGALHVFGRFKNGICKYNGARRWRHGWKDLDSDTLDGSLCYSLSPHEFLDTVPSRASSAELDGIPSPFDREG